MVGDLYRLKVLVPSNLGLQVWTPYKKNAPWESCSFWGARKEKVLVVLIKSCITKIRQLFDFVKYFWIFIFRFAKCDKFVIINIVGELFISYTFPTFVKIITMKTKKCCICKEEKPHSEFYTCGKTAAGTNKYMSRCKECDNKKAPSPLREENHLKWRNKKKQEDRAWLLEIKKGLSCLDCGMSFKEAPWLLDFHHRDPKEKSFQVGCSPTYLKPREVILNEIAKCDPLCSNCHRTRHHIEKSSI